MIPSSLSHVHLSKPPKGVVEELVDCSGGDDISLESGVARKLEVRRAL
jgi:hypothetical protein